jgi:hypothetical protein
VQGGGVDKQTMKLNVAERVALLQILPTEGDFTTLKVLRGLQESVGFSEEDHKKFKLKTKETRVSWDPVEGIKEIEIKIGDKGKEIIKEALLKMDSEKKLIPNLFTVYEKFVQDKEEKK